MLDKINLGELDIFTDSERRIILPRLEENLFGPLREFTSRPSKSFRAGLVECSFEIASQIAADSNPDSKSEKQQSNVEICRNIVELLHAGSLIVDDLQDGSDERRGSPSFHKMHGDARAVNAGNWLYFWPLRLVEKLELSDQARLRFYQRYNETLDKAHYGQTLDLGVSVDQVPQDEVSEICDYTAKQKTGALTSLALQMGLICLDLEWKQIHEISDFGLQFGALLQKFDDIGNTMSHREPGKQYEDLINHRPSWVWSVVASHYKADQYEEFKEVVRRLPDQRALEEWFDRHKFRKVSTNCAKHEVKKIEESLEKFKMVAGNAAHERLQSLCERLKDAYTKSN